MPLTTLRRFFLGLSVAVPLLPATIVVNPSPPSVATSISSSVTGADMAGLIMRATYETPGAPTTVTSVWAQTGPTSGEASAGNVSVAVTGSASAALAWRYASQFLSPLISLELDGASAGIYFDRAHSGPGTPGSGAGADISFGPLLLNGADSSAIVATYSSAVSLGANPPQNDLYARLVISFAQLPFGGLQPQDFAFTQPTDRNVIPEPNSVTLVMAGFALFLIAHSLWFRWRSFRTLPSMY